MNTTPFKTCSELSRKKTFNLVNSGYIQSPISELEVYYTEKILKTFLIKTAFPVMGAVKYANYGEKSRVNSQRKSKHYIMWSISKISHNSEACRNTYAKSSLTYNVF